MLAPLRVSVLACAASFGALVAVGLGLARPDALIERTYADAFDRLEQARSAGPARAAAMFDPALLHLSRLPAGTVPVAPALHAALAVGDRITLAQRTGGNLAYEVIEVRPLAGAALGDVGPALPGLLMVTAVTSGRLPAQTIRFIIDTEATGERATVPTVKPHAL